MKKQSVKKTKPSHPLDDLFKKRKLLWPKSTPYFEVIREVRNILGLTDFEYKRLVFEIGLKWIDERNFKDPKDAKRLAKRKWFWALFEPQYYKSDGDFVEKVWRDELYQLDRKELMELYKDMHQDIILDPRTPEEKYEELIYIITNRK